VADQHNPAPKQRRLVPSWTVLVVLGALLVGAVIGALAFDTGGSPAPGGASPTGSGATPGGATAGRREQHGPLGLSIVRPRGWSSSQHRGVLRMLSPDQSASLAISAPAASGRQTDLRRSDTRELLRLFKPAHVLGRQRGVIARTPVLTTELVGVTPSHRHVRILSTALSSPYRTYSIQVFTAPTPPAVRLTQVRDALASIDLFAPTK
jgi:hypothetical protein